MRACLREGGGGATLAQLVFSGDNDPTEFFSGKNPYEKLRITHSTKFGELQNHSKEHCIRLACFSRGTYS